MKKAVLTLATITTLVTSAVSSLSAQDSFLNRFEEPKKAEIGTILGIGSFESDVSVFAAVSKLNSNDYGEIIIEASKDNIDINLYKPVKIFEDVVSVGFESGYLKFKDYDPAGSVGLATTFNYYINAPYFGKQVGIYLKTGFDLGFGSVRKTKEEVVTNTYTTPATQVSKRQRTETYYNKDGSTTTVTYNTIENEVQLNSIFRTTLAVGYDRFIAGVSYKRINLLNTNQDNRVNFFVGYSFKW